MNSASLTSITTNSFAITSSVNKPAKLVLARGIVLATALNNSYAAVEG